MSLTPTISLGKLGSLRAREKFIHILWGLTRWLALAVTLLAAAAFIDWKLDSYSDTPFWVRATSMLVQIVALAVAGLFWIVWPWLRGPSMIGLARRVEERIPEFDHRLVTSIQLTHRDARVAGMSGELIQRVTVEAEQISERHNLARLADTRRLKWSLALFAWPLAIICVLLAFLGSETLAALLQRQMLADVEIPRDMRLTATTVKNPRPAGDDVFVSYEVTSQRGRLTKETVGQVYYTVDEGGHQGEHKLAWDEESDFSPYRAVFKARIPQSSANFHYRARLGDGRTHHSDEVWFVPRPQVTVDSVWIQSPEYIAGRPETRQTTKNIRALDGARARVKITVQKPISSAELTLYRLNDKGIAVKAGTQPMQILPPETVEEGSQTATVHPAESGYIDLKLADPRKPVAFSVSARDEYGFDSIENPRGIIEILEPKTPYVKLLPERFVGYRGEKFNEDQVLEGFPVKLGGNIMVEYKFRSDIGAATPYRRRSDNQLIEPAWLVYRVNDGPWEWLKLNEVPETEESGPYDPENATFANLVYQKEKLNNEVPFHARPAADKQSPGRLEGGGFFEIRTEKLSKVDADGKRGPLELNDRIGFYVAIYDCDPAANRPPGTSDYREKTIKSEKEVSEQAEQARREVQRIQEITRRQQAITARPR